LIPPVLYHLSVWRAAEECSRLRFGFSLNIKKGGTVSLVMRSGRGPDAVKESSSNRSMSLCAGISPPAAGPASHAATPWAALSFVGVVASPPPPWCHPGAPWSPAREPSGAMPATGNLAN
jgi:hypothetical protein